jgi:hypothetical protein
MAKDRPAILAVAARRDGRVAHVLMHARAAITADG